MVSGAEFRDGTDGRRELHVAIGFEPGLRFHRPEESCPVHDVRERVWRHLDFFRYKAFIHAGVPRVSCPAHGVVAVGGCLARAGQACHRAWRIRRPQPVDQQGLLPVRQVPQIGAWVFFCEPPPPPASTRSPAPAPRPCGATPPRHCRRLWHSGFVAAQACWTGWRSCFWVATRPFRPHDTP